ncbi:MAG: glycosyltransferase, partial [Clostridia bacterium]|nr:glycosyltransferase [Clostridia bacterium]
GCLPERIRLLPPTEDVFFYHAASDILLSASRSETFSYALAEALYMERPAVLSDIPGTAWAAGYESATVFPSGDDRACAEALLKAAAGFSPDTLARCRARIAKECALERWVEGVLGVYGALMDGTQDFSSRAAS